MLIIRGVNVFPSQIEELILKQRRFAPNYFLELGRDGHLDTLTVHVEWPAGGPSGVEAREAAARDLAHHVKSSVGITIRVCVEDPGTIDRSHRQGAPGRGPAALGVSRGTATQCRAGRRFGLSLSEYSTKGWFP